MSESTRQLKVAKLLQKELSRIFQEDKRGVLGKDFMTISEVRVSPDLSFAKVYISMMLVKDKAQAMDNLNTHKKEIRKALGNSIAKQMRIVPELSFILDEVDEKAARLDELIKNLHIPPATE